MRSEAENGVGDRRTLAAAFRKIRRRRRMRSPDVAAAMQMPLRTYQHLESGRGCFYAADLTSFARATDCDPLALLIGASLKSADFAGRCADLKLATLAVLFVEDLHVALGDNLSGLNAASIVSALAEATVDLRRQAALLPADPTFADPRAENLTRRQLECLEWVRAGKSSADIGDILGVSARTVDDHIGKACRWLGVRTRLQAVETALRLGVLQTYP